MPRRPTRTVPTVLLPGIAQAGTAQAGTAQDWPYWLADRLTSAGREIRIAGLAPAELAGSLGVLRDTLAGLPADGFDVLAHSASCLLWLHHVADSQAVSNSPRPARVALVAPPAPGSTPVDWNFLLPVPLDVDALRRAAEGTVLVGADNDPYCPGGVAAVYGAPLKMAATVITSAGPLTAGSGYGPWPAVLDWCGRDNLAFLA